LLEDTCDDDGDEILAVTEENVDPPPRKRGRPRKGTSATVAPKTKRSRKTSTNAALSTDTASSTDKAPGAKRQLWTIEEHLTLIAIYHDINVELEAKHRASTLNATYVHKEREEELIKRLESAGLSARWTLKACKNKWQQTMNEYKRVKDTLARTGGGGLEAMKQKYYWFEDMDRAQEGNAAVNPGFVFGLASTEDDLPERQSAFGPEEVVGPVELGRGMSNNINMPNEPNEPSEADAPSEPDNADNASNVPNAIKSRTPLPAANPAKNPPTSLRKRQRVADADLLEMIAETRIYQKELDEARLKREKEDEEIRHRRMMEMIAAMSKTVADAVTAAMKSTRWKYKMPKHPRQIQNPVDLPLAVDMSAPVDMRRWSDADCQGWGMVLGKTVVEWNSWGSSVAEHVPNAMNMLYKVHPPAIATFRGHAFNSARAFTNAIYRARYINENDAIRGPAVPPAVGQTATALFGPPRESTKDFFLRLGLTEHASEEGARKKRKGLAGVVEIDDADDHIKTLIIADNDDNRIWNFRPWPVEIADKTLVMLTAAREMISRLREYHNGQAKNLLGMEGYPAFDAPIEYHRERAAADSKTLSATLTAVLFEGEPHIMVKSHNRWICVGVFGADACSPSAWTGERELMGNFFVKPF
ncbi:hypothetical protein HDU85_001429, partial [Gaertneriomyces sp. JEL0708]